MSLQPGPLLPAAEKEFHAPHGDVLEERERSARLQAGRSSRPRSAAQSRRRNYSAAARRRRGDISRRPAALRPGSAAPACGRPRPEKAGSVSKAVRRHATKRSLSSTRSRRSCGPRISTSRRVTAPVPGPTSRIRRGRAAGCSTKRAKAAARRGPLGKIAPVV